MKIFSHENFCKWNFISALSLNPMPSEGNRVVITSHRSHCLMFGCTAFQMFYSVVNVTKKFSIHFWILVNSSNTSCSNKPWQQRWQITMTFQKRGRDIGGRNTKKKKYGARRKVLLWKMCWFGQLFSNRCICIVWCCLCVFGWMWFVPNGASSHINFNRFQFESF